MTEGRLLLSTFIFIVCAVVGVILGLSLYFLRFLARDGQLRAARIGVLLFDVLGVSSLFLFFRVHASDGWGGWVVLLVILFFVGQCLTLVLTMLGVVLRYLWRMMITAPHDPARRRMLVGAAAYPVAGILLSTYGTLFERLHTVRRDYVIPIVHLPHEAEGMVIAQISDIHLGVYFSVEDLDALLVQIAETKPDLLAVTGDIFDDEQINSRAAEILASHAKDYPDGIWYCIGNHEYYRNARPLVERLKQESHIHILLNGAERVVGRGDFYIAGVDYPFARGAAFYKQKAEYFAAAMKEVPAGALTVLLAHHPEFIDDAAEYGTVPLTLTGHTHGSQFGIIGHPLFPVFKYTRGMVRKNENYGYVHCGNGSWFPVRIGCPPEVAYFRLERVKQ